MKGFYPKAVVKEIKPGSTDPAIKPTVAILHVDAGNASSLYDLFKRNQTNGSGVEAHFFIKKDGTVEQYRSIYYQCDANLKANGFAVSIETQGYAEGTWTVKQLATIKRLLVWLHQEAGIPLIKCTTWQGPGVGYHTQFGAPGAWTPVAKSCPGPDRIKQFERDIVPWMHQKQVYHPYLKDIHDAASAAAALAATRNNPAWEKLFKNILSQVNKQL